MYLTRAREQAKNGLIVSIQGRRSRTHKNKLAHMNEKIVTTSIDDLDDLSQTQQGQQTDQRRE